MGWQTHLLFFMEHLGIFSSLVFSLPDIFGGWNIVTRARLNWNEFLSESQEIMYSFKVLKKFNATIELNDSFHEYTLRWSRTFTADLVWKRMREWQKHKGKARELPVVLETLSWRTSTNDFYAEGKRKMLEARGKWIVVGPLSVELQSDFALDSK